MTPTRYEQVRQVFVAAQRLPADERPQFLSQHDAELVREVQQLLADAEDGSSFLGSPAVASNLAAGLLETHHNPGDQAGSATISDDSECGAASTLPATASAIPGTQIGPYRILRTIGEGGMGTVYEAEQRSPIVRKVALKVVKWGMDTREVIARFESERQALALMDHANIARVLDAGATETGRPYFVMELVKGEPITKYCDGVEMPVRDRLELFVQVCHAVQHAHTKGIIHRDIKSSNVLVTLADGKPVPKVIDFGIAKATSGKLTDKTVVTEFRQILGTPAYMSPEQAELTALDIDTRSDVYSLGVLLYELLTSQLPFDPIRLRSASLAELQRIIRDEEPPTPSSRISTLGASATDIASRRRSEVQRLRRTLRGDLDWIVMKCLEKDRSRRYETANGLADDVNRCLVAEPVLAAPPSTAYRATKFVRRNKGPVAAGMVIVLSLSAGLSAALWQAERASTAEIEQRKLAQSEADARRESEGRRERAEKILDFMKQTLQFSDPDWGGRRDISIAEAMEHAVETIDAGTFADDPQTEADLRDAIANILLNNGDAAKAEPLAVRVLEIVQRLRTGDHTDVELALNTLASVRNALGRLEEAESLAVDALAMGRRLHTGDHPYLARDLNNLAVVRMTLGRPAEAEPLFVQALEMSQRLHPGDHSAVARSLDNVAKARMGMGRIADAEPLMVQALEMRQRLYTGDHADLATGFANLAAVRQEQGRYAEAERLIVEALDMARRLYKGDHPNVATGLEQLALVCQARGDLARAESLILESLAMRQRLFPSDHPQVATPLDSLAQVRMHRGDLPEAESLFRESLGMRKRMFSGDHQDVAQSLNRLAQLLKARGDLTEAESLFRESLAMYQRLFPGDHPHVATSLSNLASLLLARQDPLGAEPLVRESLAMRKRLFPNDHPNVLAGEYALGVFCWSRGELDQSIPLFEKVLAGRVATLGAQHPDTQLARGNLGVNYKDAGRRAEAIPLLAEAWRASRHVANLRFVAKPLLDAYIEASERDKAVALIQELLTDARTSLSEKSVELAGALAEYSQQLLVLKAWNEVEPLLRECLVIREEAMPDDWRMFNAKSMLGGSLLGQKRYAEAEPLLLAGYRGMAEREAGIPPQGKVRIRESLERLVQLYEATGNQTEAAGWRAKLAVWQASTQPASIQPAGEP